METEFKFSLSDPSVFDQIAQNAKINIKGFVRFETGEGLEKKNEDFAAEVAAQLQK